LETYKLAKDNYEKSSAAAILENYSQSNIFNAYSSPANRASFPSAYNTNISPYDSPIGSYHNHERKIFQSSFSFTPRTPNNANDRPMTPLKDSASPAQTNQSTIVKVDSNLSEYNSILNVSFCM